MQGRDSETEARILKAARTVFIRRGTAGARMQEIAEEAGVNQALLHYYFRSKERLAATVFREAAAKILPAVLGVFASDLPLAEKIERFVHIYIDTVRQSPFIPGYVVAEMHHHPERLTAMLAAQGIKAADVVAPLREKLAVELRESAARGEIRPIDPENFLLSLIGPVVFPFVARPALRIALDIDDADFERILDERRRILPGMILNSLRP
jgi:TetR/AcrR family transcriptional regulator